MKKQKRFSSEAEERGFTLPVLHQASHWYVDFYARHLETEEMKRKRYAIPMYLPPRERKERASFLISRLTQQLMEGWSPWNDERTNSGIHGFTLFSKCIALYLEAVNSKGRKKTKDNYLSRMNILMLFVESTDNKIKYAWEFDTRLCKCFIEWLINTLHICPRTANNYRGWLHGLGEFLVNHRFIIRNPVNELPILPEHEKIRKDIDEDMLARLAEYLKEDNLFFYLACLMEYYTMIRPSELVNLKVGDIHIEKQAIYVDGSFSKNYRSSLVGLNDAIMRVIIQLDIASYPSDYFLFSDYFMPGKTQKRADMLNKKWKKVREALGWPRCYQFCSLKDSGIRNLANAEGVVVARDQARHSDVAVTNKYIQQHEAHECTKHFKGALD